ncbi:MAG: Maf family protein [Bacilli bacterium]|nr:Maf family protein [Bacilli bacterium]
MIVLGSSSPRRKELLKKLVKEFDIVSPDVDEDNVSVPPESLPAELSKLKAEAVRKLRPNDIILSCDTIVLLNGRVLGKPKDEEDAVKMLLEESGKKQTVLSGYTFIDKNGDSLTRTVSTDVYFNKLSEEKIREYVQKKKPLDKAGAYGIQDGCDLIDRIEGSYDNVMGLPTEDIALYCKF